MDTETKSEGRAVPWNKGKLLGQKPPLKLREIWAIRIRLQLTHRHRELALFNLAIDSKLRGCDLVGLHVYDVVQGSHVAPRAIVMQKKTQRAVQFEVTEQTRDALSTWIATAKLKPEQFLFQVASPSLRICRLDSTLESLHRGSHRSDLIRWLTARIRCVGRKPR